MLPPFALGTIACFPGSFSFRMRPGMQDSSSNSPYALPDTHPLLPRGSLPHTHTPLRQWAGTENNDPKPSQLQHGMITIKPFKEESDGEDEEAEVVKTVVNAEVRAAGKNPLPAKDAFGRAEQKKAALLSVVIPVTNVPTVSFATLAPPPSQEQQNDLPPPQQQQCLQHRVRSSMPGSKRVLARPGSEREQERGRGSTQKVSPPRSHAASPRPSAGVAVVDARLADLMSKLDIMTSEANLHVVTGGGERRGRARGGRERAVINREEALVECVRGIREMVRDSVANRTALAARSKTVSSLLSLIHSSCNATIVEHAVTAILNTALSPATHRALLSARVAPALVSVLQGGGRGGGGGSCISRAYTWSASVDCDSDYDVGASGAIAATGSARGANGANAAAAATATAGATAADAEAQAAWQRAAENAAAALFALTSSLEESRHVVGSTRGAIEGLVGMLAQGAPWSTRGRKDAALALFNLGLYVPNRPAMVASGMVPAALAMLRCNQTLHVHAMAAATTAVTATASSSSSAASDSVGGSPREGGGGAADVDSASTTTDSSAPEGAATMASPFSSPVSPTGETASLEDKAAALLTCAAKCETGRAAIRAAGGIAALAETVESGRERAREEATATLLLLVEEGNREVVQEVREEGVMPTLTALQRTGTPRTQLKVGGCFFIQCVNMRGLICVLAGMAVR